MFISHLFAHAQPLYSYLLRDSEFEEMFYGYSYDTLDKEYTTEHARSKIVSGIIRIYERRNLPVAANFALVMRYEAKYYQCVDNIDVMVWINMCPEYPKYKNDIEKYLLLL